MGGVDLCTRQFISWHIGVAFCLSDCYEMPVVSGIVALQRVLLFQQWHFVFGSPCFVFFLWHYAAFQGGQE